MDELRCHGGSHTSPAKADTESLTETFHRLGYDILVYQNITRQEIKTNLDPATLHAFYDLSRYASLVFCYIGHGAKGSVTGVDDDVINGGPNSVMLNEILYPLNCAETLRGKPKINIIAACQGTNEQYVSTGHSAYQPATIVVDVPTVSHPLTADPPQFDILNLMGTVEDYYFYTGKSSNFL